MGLIAALLAIDAAAAGWLWALWTARHSPNAVATGQPASTGTPASRGLPAALRERAAGVSTKHAR